eukprot:TRINITY_DN3994_c0_g2_i1.p1 TRINITY_DN3994_c0_g2~~TRINITY_DN3994_c0_g2_i1.p1  ORF type:complete len:951 (-),score=146.12 TRINITY_DN3994_c0_g2_i1:350-3202(-)
MAALYHTAALGGATLAKGADLKTSFLQRGKALGCQPAGRIPGSVKKVAMIRNVASEPKASTDVPPVASPLSDSSDVLAVASSIKYHKDYTPIYSPKAPSKEQVAYVATAQSVRDTLLQRWNETAEHFDKTNGKEVAYLSMEFLQGRALINALGSLELTGPYSEALKKLGVSLEDLVEQEPNAALGNGGLGRLASCFLDSIATLNYPGFGYGLRYKYGLFKQTIEEDGQHEFAENWLETEYPWEVVRHDINYNVRFFGHVENGQWVGGENVKAVAYDLPIPGYKTKNTISLRMWSTEILASDFDLAAFNAGDHVRAAAAQANASKLCAVLYPGDGTDEGKLLRLKQQYLLCSASLQDILARFEARNGPNWDLLPQKVALQMNDTHPTLAAPELMRILMDLKGLGWEQAWKITQATVAYTNHTVLPEALEKWSIELVQRLLPRHFEIIRKIDEDFIDHVVSTVGLHDPAVLVHKIDAMRVLDGTPLPDRVKQAIVAREKEIEEEEAAAKAAAEAAAKAAKEAGEPLPEEEPEAKKPKTEKVDLLAVTGSPVVRMANLCVIAGHAVNGVAAIHSEIVKDDVFNDFYQLWPHKFQNKTNGVTPRRWIRFCNPALSNVITKWLGTEEWVLNADLLKGLEKHADNPDLQREWSAAKRENKETLAKWVKEKTGYTLNPDVMFDIQVKRIHEYKRQLLNILGVVYRYKKMKEMSADERKAKFAPRAVIFGGKAFATYVQAKRIVRFICDVARTVNNDPEIGDLLKVVFVPDYNVSVAEVLIPASELSQHISTAGMEASGTSNMKFQMNGCLIIGTLDGANVEIREEVGDDNFFLFGARAEEIAELRLARGRGEFVPDPRFEEVKAYVRSGVFCGNNYDELIGSLEGNEGYGRADYFLVGYDFPSYIECQDEVDKAYRDQKRWTRSSILSTANSGKFSSDRTIKQYADEIWGLDGAPAP